MNQTKKAKYIKSGDWITWQGKSVIARGKTIANRRVFIRTHCGLNIEVGMDYPFETEAKL